MTMKTPLALAAAVTLLAWVLPASAQHAPETGPAKSQEGAAHDASHDTPHGGANHAADASHDLGPVPPEKDGTRWAGVLLIIILTFFVLAAVIGPVVRAHAPPVEMPPTHSHDEPPGASHHHGSQGTINPDHGDHSHGHGHGHGHH